MKEHRIYVAKAFLSSVTRGAHGAREKASEGVKQGITTSCTGTVGRSLMLTLLLNTEA